MAKWKLSFVLLLQLTTCFSSEVTLVKTLSGKPDVTPICGNEALQNIIIIVCKIRTEVNGGEECRLLYRRSEQSFGQNCDSRFTLRTENQTVVLHLTSLTPVDSGNYTCECSYADGASTLHLKITVEEKVSPRFNLSVWIGVAAFIIVTGVTVGCICRTKRNRSCSRLTTSGSSGCEPPASVDQDDPDDPYTNLQYSASDPYWTVSKSASSVVTFHSDNQDEETDQSCTIYENI